MLVSLGKLDPYLDGYKVTLEIGNILSATFNGFDLTAIWGPRFKTGGDYGSWNKARKMKTFSQLGNLLPNRWTDIEIIFPATEAKDVGSIEIQVVINKISLQK